MLQVEKIENIGDLECVMYTFEQIGDTLPKHNHTKYDSHVTIVARGSIKARSHDWEVELVAGQIADFKEGEPHEFVALEANSRVFNITKFIKQTAPAICK